MQEQQIDIQNQEQEMDSKQILQYLEELLSRQVERLRQYDLDGAMQLAGESEKFAQQVNAAGLLDDPANAEYRERIQGLYQELRLVINSEQKVVSDKMDQIRTAIRTLSAYSNRS